MFQTTNQISYSSISVQFWLCVYFGPQGIITHYILQQNIPSDKLT